MKSRVEEETTSIMDSSDCGGRRWTTKRYAIEYQAHSMGEESPCHHRRWALGISGKRGLGHAVIPLHSHSSRESCEVCRASHVYAQLTVSLVHSPISRQVSPSMPVSLAVGDIASFRKYVKSIGRAYQKRSVAMIQLCRLFLEISPGKPDQIDALRRFW